jgi:enoyl-CoA hydratase/carnithine racemase
MNGFQTLIYEKMDAIASVTLNRPEALNVYNIQMRDDLYEVLSAIKDDDEIRVAIFKGAGDRAFCAGADLSEFLTAPAPAEARRVRWERDVWGLFLSIPQRLVLASYQLLVRPKRSRELLVGQGPLRCSSPTGGSMPKRPPG